MRRIRQLPAHDEEPRTVFVAFSPAGTNASAVRGKWGTPFATNMLAVHAHLLPTGKVFFWGKQGEARLWDPAHPTAAFADVTKAYPIYCTGHTFLPDGRLLIVGGACRRREAEGGFARRHLRPRDQRDGAPRHAMAQGRYYPTLAALPSGTDPCRVGIGPDRGGGDGAGDRRWRELAEAHRRDALDPEPYYPAMFVAPNGKVFLAGFPATSRYLSVDGDRARGRRWPTARWRTGPWAPR